METIWSLAMPVRFLCLLLFALWQPSIAVAQTAAEQRELSRADQLERLSAQQYELGHLGAAEESITRSLKIYRDVLGPGDARTLDRELSLIWTINNTGDFLRAQSMLEDNIKGWRALQPSRSQWLRHEESLHVRLRYNIQLLERLGDSFERIAILEEIHLRMRENPGHYGNSNMLGVLSHLAAAYQDAGQVERAESLKRRLLFVWTELDNRFGSQERSVLVAASNLAGTLNEQGRY